MLRVPHVETDRTIMQYGGEIIAMLLGVGSSAALHISQALMRLGIVRMRGADARRRDRLAYGLGLVLNFSAPFWVMAANLFADTLWFTSMFATGLVALLLFSCLVLKEPVTRHQVIGSTGIVTGTLLIAVAGFRGSTGLRMDLGTDLLLMVSLLWGVVMPSLAALSRGRPLALQESVFGLAAGGFLALDALWKGLAQRRADGGVGLLPDSAAGWWLLLASFGGALGAFLMMQWSYLRHCRAYGVVVGYNLMYVTLPLAVAGLITLISTGLPWSPLIVGGLVVMFTGAMISQKR